MHASSSIASTPFFLSQHSKLETERIAYQHYAQFSDVESAVKFAEQIEQVWPSVALLYANKEAAASYMMLILRNKKGARVCARNLRLVAGQPAKFSDSPALRPRL